MDWFDKIVSIFFSFLILFNAIVVKRIVGVWLFPACIYSLFWFVMTIFPLIAGLWIPIEPYGVGYIALTSIIASSASIIFNWKSAFVLNKIKPSPQAVYGNRYMLLVVCCSSVIAIVSMMTQINLTGRSFERFLYNVFEIAGQYSAQRYAGDIQTTLIYKIGLLSAYITILSGGLYYGSIVSNRKRLGVLIISFLPSIIVMLTQSAKGVVFLSIALFMGGIMVTRLYSGRYVVVDKMDMYTFFKVFPVLLIMVTISMISRGLYNQNDIKYVGEKIVGNYLSYSSGHLYAFSSWFASFVFDGSKGYTDDAYTFGFYSFMSIFKIFGDNRVVPMGIYTEYYAYGEFFKTNIYTAFRGAINDYGLFGSFVIVYIVSLFVHTSFYIFLRTKTPLISVSIFIFAVGAIYMSYIISIMTWNVIPVSFALFTLLLLLNRLLQRKKGVSI